MSFSHLQLALPASWTIGSWHLDRPFSFGEEAAGLPQAYVKATDLRNADRRICDFYIEELETRFGTRVSGDPTPDILARAVIERRFKQALDSRAGDKDPPYYYGYFEGKDRDGRPAGIPLRMVGLLPRARQNVYGILLDLRGYGHTFDHDWDRTEDFLKNGFAVFTPDRAEHGLSARLDPRRPSLRGMDLFAQHAAQSLEILGRFRRQDARLKKAPLFAVASSMGAAELVGAMRLKNTNFGIDTILFDNPLFSFGSRYGWLSRRIMTLIVSAFTVYPRSVSEWSSSYQRKRPPERYPRQSDGCYRRSVRFSRAFAPARHPVALFDLPRLVEANRDWLQSDATQNILPATLTTFAEGDKEVDVDDNIELFRSFRRPNKDGLRATSCHSPFLVGDDLDLVEDVVDFFLNANPFPARIVRDPKNLRPVFSPKL